MRRRNRSPLEIQRVGFALMALAVLAGGWSGATESPYGMIAVLLLSVAAAGCYVRAADFLLDVNYRGVRKQATLLTIAGVAAALLGCVAASQFVEGRASLRTLAFAGIGGGFAAGLSGLITLLWTFSGTYAGEQIEKRSNEEW